MKKTIIYDEMPLYTIIDGKEHKQENVLNDNDGYNKKLNVNKDGCGSSPRKKKKSDSVSIYAIITTADKEINSRMYDKESTIRNVINKDWCKPFTRPLLKNHNLCSEPHGRVVDTYSVDHNDYSVITSSNEMLPNVIVPYLKDKGFLKSGSVSTLGLIETDEETFDAIESGLYNTVSQSSYMDSFTCNICGKSYYEDCNHVAGKTYTLDESGNNKKCIPKAAGFRPVELSIVNSPANDSSIFIVYDSAKGTINGEIISQTNADSENGISKVEDGFDINTNIINNDMVIKNNDNKEVNKLENKQVQITRDLVVETYESKIVDSFGTAFFEASKKHFETLVNMDQIQDFKEFLKTVTTDKKVADEAQKESVLAAATVIETKDESTTEKVIVKDEKVEEVKLEAEEESIKDAEDKLEKASASDDCQAGIISNILIDEKSKKEIKIQDKELEVMLKNFSLQI